MLAFLFILLTPANGQQIAMTVVDANKAESLVNGEQAIAVNGEVLDTSNLSDPQLSSLSGQVFCTLTKLNDLETKLHDGMGLTVFAFSDTEVPKPLPRRRLLIEFNEAGFGVGCTKTTDSPFTWSEIAASLKSIIALQQVP